MIIGIHSSPTLYGSLRCWDIHDEEIREIVWFNPTTMIASAYVKGTEVRIEIGKFCFEVQDELLLDAVKDKLPAELHDYITIT